MGNTWTKRAAAYRLMAAGYRAMAEVDREDGRQALADIGEKNARLHDAWADDAEAFSRRAVIDPAGDVPVGDFVLPSPAEVEQVRGHVDALRAAGAA